MMANEATQSIREEKVSLIAPYYYNTEQRITKNGTNQCFYKHVWRNSIRLASNDIQFHSDFWDWSNIRSLYCNVFKGHEPTKIMASVSNVIGHLNAKAWLAGFCEIAFIY